MRERLVVAFQEACASDTRRSMQTYLNMHPNMKLIGFTAPSEKYYIAVFEDESERNV